MPTLLIVLLKNRRNLIFKYILWWFLVIYDNPVLYFEISFIFFAFSYRQVSYISRTESKNLNVSRLGLAFSLRNILKPGVKPRMKM